MRVPFDKMSARELEDPFADAGFAEVFVSRVEHDLVVPGGTAAAVDMAYATPIGPRLRALPENRQARFLDALTALLDDLSGGGTRMGTLVANELSAVKP